MSTLSVEQAARELYAVEPNDFVARRGALAKSAADPEVAARIRRLRKPSIAAWIVNLFARERPAQLAQALQLADELREAQADLDARTLAQLGRERRALTGRLAQEAAGLAKAKGERVTEATLEAVRETLSAAFFDQDAAAAVASGRLVRELEPSGSLPADLDAVIAGGRPRPPEPVAQPEDEVTARRERRQAERALRMAEQEMKRAEQAQAQADREQQESTGRLERLTARIAEQEAELAQLRRQSGDAEVEARGSGQARQAAAARVAAAKGAVADARRALE